MEKTLNLLSDYLSITDEYAYTNILLFGPQL